MDGSCLFRSGMADDDDLICLIGPLCQLKSRTNSGGRKNQTVNMPSSEERSEREAPGLPAGQKEIKANKESSFLQLSASENCTVLGKPDRAKEVGAWGEWRCGRYLLMEARRLDVLS